MLTIKDIAEEASCSVMMVSRVINKKYDQVSKKNVKKIEAIIKKHNFTPNASARTLSSKSSKIIGAFIEGDGITLSLPYQSMMIGQIIENIQGHNYDTLVKFIGQTSNIEAEIKTRNIDAVIFFGLMSDTLTKIRDEMSVPIIFNDCYTTSHNLPSVGIDDFKGGRLSARHFIDNGHTNFYFVGDSIFKSDVVNERYKGFKAELSEHGFTLDDSRLLHYEDANNVINAIVNDEKHKAIFVPSDLICFELINKFSQKGIVLAKDYSLIGFDNLPMCEIFGLTTICQNIKEKAKYTVDLLFNYIENPKAPSQTIKLDVSLIERNSVLNLGEKND